jgi:predicted TIM-barrel fold metal-dependent hydrolase
LIIDFHSHVGSFQTWVGSQGGTDEMLPIMDQAGIDKACVFNVFHGRASQANEETAGFVAAHPDRFIGFLFVTPHYPEEMEGEMVRAVDDLGFAGIKIYPPYFNRPVTDPIWEPVFAFAHDRRLPVISHSDGKNPNVNPNQAEPHMFVQWAERFPDANIVLGHAGNNRNGRESCIRAARQCKNIYVEICTSWRHLHSIESLVQGAGEDRVLFGSDMPLMDPRIHLGRVLTAQISSRAKSKVLGENAARLLRLSE